MEYVFEWDTAKAALNQRKHRVSFERASTIFLDPQAISILDDSPQDDDERWATIGIDDAGRLLVAVHTFEELGDDEARIRLISARKATKREARAYSPPKR